VFRTRPRGMLLGAFFDVPNLMEVAARFAGLDRRCRHLANSTPGSLGATMVGESPALPGDGGVCRPRRRRDLEEEIEAQEGQGVDNRKRASALQTIRTDNASKVPLSQRAAPEVSAMMPPARIPQERTPGGPGLRVTGARRADGNILRGVVASRGSRLASAGPLKRGEPHGRLQDATSLRAVARRKPARW